MRTVLFDFDSTLTTKDTFRPLARHFARNNFFKLWLIYFLLTLYKIKLIKDKPLKEIFLKLFAKNLNQAQMGKKISAFIEKILPPFLNKATLDILNRHLKAGDRVFLVSANFDFFLEPIVKRWELQGLICTETQKINSCFTGKIIGPTCKGRDKLNKVINTLGETELKNTIAYGDPEDELLLSNAEEGIKIKC